MCRFNNRFPPDGFLTSGRGKNDVNFASDLLSLQIEDHGSILTKAEEVNTMISGEDESSSVINGRLRPRKSTANIPNPPNKYTHKPENKVAQDRPKRNSTPSKASPNKQDDLTAKADSLPLAQLCPYCDKKFTTKLAASKHARRIHLSTAKQDNFINCLFCNHSEAVSSNIIRHMVDSHPNQYFACLDCNTRFFSTSELAEHKLNVCEKQKQAYRSKLRQKTSSLSKKDQKKISMGNKTQYAGQDKELKLEPEFNGLVISCELKPSHGHDAVDIEDNITTNLILPSNIGNTVLQKNALMILDDIQWNRRIPPNFSFRNADADQILSRLGVVHRSPRVGESTRREWLKMIDATSQKFEKCFDTTFYSRVASNVQQNLAKFLDGSFNFSPDPDKVIKTRKSKSSTIINTAEGFPILLPHEQYSRNRFDGYMPRAIAPKHKWKWDSTENEKHIIIDASVMKRDNHVDNCIITLVSSLDIWTQLRMRRKFEEIFCKAATEKIEKQNIIGRELKEILESREIPSSSSQVVEYSHRSSTSTAIVAVNGASDFPNFLGLTARGGRSESPVQPAVLSGEWVRPRCYVCCACGDQTRDSRALTAHMAAHHPNAQVQHYEIVGESLLNADILKHLYVPPSQMSNRTRPLRGFRDCTKCKKSITMEDLHQHMLDCAGDTPTVRRKCRSRPFGVRRRRPRLPDNSIRKKMRKDLRTRHNQKALLRTRPRIRTEVGDAETIRKMIADLPAKRHRQAAGNVNTQQVLRPRRKLDKQRNKLKIKRLASKNTNTRKLETKNDINDSLIIDEDDQPLKPKTKIEPEKTVPAKKRSSSRFLASKNKKVPLADKEVLTVNEHQQDVPSDNANVSQPQQMSSENSTQRLNINAQGNDTRGEEENRGGADNNDNGDDRKKSPDKEQDKDNHKSVAPDPTLLKHSINSITASSNKASQSQQQNLLPQQANEADGLCDTGNTFLENEVGPSLPEKPPLQSNRKRSSQKKRESLLNCIEKIKAKTTEQKGETTTTMYDSKQAFVSRLNSSPSDHENMPLMDPHPAVISRTRDESGAAKNVVPSRIAELPMDVSGEPYQSEKDMNYRWRSDIDVQRKPNEMLMLVPMAEPFYVHKKSPEIEFASLKTKHPGGQRRKSSSTRLPLAHNEQAAQLQLAHLYYQRQWNLGSLPYASMAQAHLQQQIEQSQRMPFPEMLLQQHQLNEAFKNAQFRNQSLSATEPYNTPDVHYEGRRDYIPLRNETSQQSLTTKQQNQNILSVSPQSWSRETTQFQQMNNNLTVPNMLPSIAANELVIPFARRTPQKRVSESSETEYAYGNFRNLNEADMLNYVNLRRMSSDTTNMYLPAGGQGSRESSHHSLPRFRAQIDVSGDKNIDFPTLTQDGYGSKTKRSYENRSGFNDSTSKGAEYYRTTQSHTTAVNKQFYTSRVGEDKHQSNPRTGNNIDDSKLENHDDLLAKCLYFSNMNKKKLQERYMAENAHLFISVPSENQAATITPSPNESTIRKSVDRYTHDQSDDLPISSNKDIDHHLNPNCYIEVEDQQETSENQTDSGQTDEPLDLSGKHAPPICNSNTSNICIENEQIQYGTLDLSKTTCHQSKKSAFEIHSNIEDCEQMSAEIDLIEDNASDLSFKDASFDSYVKRQQVPFIVDSAVEKPTQPNRKRSTVAYYKEINEVNSSHVKNSYIPNTFSRQISHGREIITNEKYKESLFVPNVNDIEIPKLDSQISKASASSNESYYFTSNVIPFDRFDKNNEMSTTALETQSLLETSEAIAANSVQLNSFSYHAYDNTEGMQKANHNSSIDIEPNTSRCGSYKEQNNVRKDLHSAEFIYVLNQTHNDEKTSVGNFTLNTKTPSVDQDAENTKTPSVDQDSENTKTSSVDQDLENKKTPSVDQDAENTKTLSVDQDPETAKKIARFPKELVDLLGAVPKDQHNRFVDAISQLIPPNNEGPKPIITVQEPQNVTHHQETAKMNTPPICDTSTNTENRLTINTAVLPSSSILPKKRHSPSARLTTQETYSNMTSKSSPMLKQLPTSIMSSIPNNTPIENAIECAADLKKISENECEANKRRDKIIDLTDDDFDHPKPNSHSSNSNIIPIQESINLLQSTQKNYSEKTASLRAVRIKTPLARKSISDDKQSKEVNTQQLICLDSKQRDLNTAQVSYPECGYTKIAIDNAVAQNPEYRGSSLRNLGEKKTTQNVAWIGSEASNLMSTADCDQIRQSDVGAEISNVVAEKDEMRDQTQKSLARHAPSVNPMEQENMALPNIVGNKFNEEIERKFTDNTILESKSSTFDGNCQDRFINFPNPLITMSSDNDTVVPDSANSFFSEQNSIGVAKTTPLATEKSKGGQNPHVDDIDLNLKSNKNSITIMSLEPEILQHNEFKDSTTIFSEDEDSDDDVSLAVIVKQKQQGQTIFSSNDESTSAIIINDLSLRPGPKESKKGKKSKNNYKKSLKNVLNQTDSQLLTINIKQNDTVSIEPKVESEVNEANKNDVNKENHEMYGFEHIKENGISESFNQKEDDKRVALENTLFKNFELPAVPDVSNQENIDTLSQIHSNENIEEDSLHGILNENSSISDIESNIKSKISNTDIEKTVQNTDTNGPQLSYSELYKNIEEGSSTQYFRADQENKSLIDETNNLIGIQNTQTDLESLSAIKQRTNELETSKTVELILLAEPGTSTKLNETSERTLRRSRRAKSMYLNNKDSFDHDTKNTDEDNETVLQKIPVTKKQLIFSKLLLDENTHAKNDSNAKFDLPADTKVLPAKRKKSPGKTKSKKKKSSDMEHHDNSSATNTFICTPDNNKNITDNELQSPNTSSETLNRSLESGAIENERTFELNVDYSTDDVPTEKRKIFISAKNIKRTKINIKTDDTFKQDSIIDAPLMNADTEINGTGSTKNLERSLVKSNESIIDNAVAGTSGYYDLKKQPEKTNTCVEIRTACYNRPIVSKQAGSTSISVKNPENYDPYDIDLEMDIAETSRPAVKRKSNKSVSGNSKSSKKCLTYENHTDKIRHKPEIEKPEITASNTSPPSLSDSDSSISDVPLQKYVEEKEKLKIEGVKSSDSNKPENNSEPNSSLIDASEDNMDESELASQNVNGIIDSNEHVDESDLGITNNTALPPSSSRDETDEVTPGRNDDTIDIQMNQGADQIENAPKPSTAKLNNKQKNKRRSTTTKKTSKVSKKPKKSDQPPVDKCLENIGFYPERQQRKSNLLAAKKISETYNMMASDDADFRPRGRPKNSSHSDNRRAATQDAINATSNTKRPTATPLTTEPQAGPSSALDEPYQANDDGEVDLITAQRMLESEEIRKLERDLYSEFKKAAQANAGRTSGINQLRAEEANPHQNNNQDVFTPTDVEVEMQTVQSPERPESPERLESPDRSESPNMPDSPESLKDKPFMYPEEEVNIYEDKYDIIKRRREASALAKQVQKVDEPKKSKPEKSKKKPERKSYKKPTKKPAYQVSQVPTKGALKGFDGIKISIPTQDLNMPPNVSPPHHRQRHSRSKKRKGPSGKARANSGSSYKSDSDANSKILSTPDVYEFQDDERPVTKGYRLTRVVDKSRSSSSENEEKPVKSKRITKEKKNAKQNEDTSLRANDQNIEKSKTKKWKGKGKGKGKGNFVDDESKKTVTPHEEERVNQKEKQREEIELCIGKLTNRSQMEQRVEYREKIDGTTVDDDDRLSDGYSDTLGNIQDNDERFNDSELEDQTVLPGTSGFVPDRNDESSYDSDSSSPTPLLSVLEGPYACTCLSEIDSDDSETERGCAHPSCRYSHLNAAKNAVMGKIFKNNAVRCDKLDDTPDEPPKPKPDLDRLFDSLLEPTTDSNEIATRTNKCPDGGSVLSTYFFTSHVKVPLEALQSKKDQYEKDVSTVDDGFSSPNHRDCEKLDKNKFECSYQTSANDIDLLKIDEDSTNNFGEATTLPIDNLYIMVSQKQIQTETTLQLPAAESSDELMEEEVSEEPEPPHTNLNNNNNATEDFLDNLEKVPESSDCIRFKYKPDDVRRTLGTQTKRAAPKSDVESSSCEDELNAAKLARRNRRANKKHKSHNKRKKASDDEESDKRRSDKDTSPPKRTRKTRKTVEENETEAQEKQREKLSPSRKSDEGISMSHDNSADAYDIPAEETGVAVQRARRKCTVGKQNVLAEHWSSSESEAEPNRTKGKKKSGRAARGNRRSREADNNECDEEIAPRPPAPKARTRAAAAREDEGSDAERDPKDKKEQELHGWIVGRSHKKLVTMLVCSKSKSRPDDKDDQEIDDDEEEKEVKETENENDKEKDKDEE